MLNSVQTSEAKALLDTLRSDLGDRKLSEKARVETLTRLKVLGRTPNIVAPLYDQAGLEILGAYAFGDKPRPASQEALRCLANALLTLPPTRKFCLNLEFDKKATGALDSAEYDDEFILSRILFLLTYDPDIDVGTLLREHELAEKISRLLSRHAEALKKTTSGSLVDQSQQMALSETLKMAFNVSSAKTDQVKKLSIAMPYLFTILTRSKVLQPPLQPPLSHTIHALANIDLNGEDFKEPNELRLAVDRVTLVLEDAIDRYPPTELDALAIPLLTILRKLHDVAGTSLKGDLKSRYLPKDDERDQPLGKSGSLASRLLRLTTSSPLVHLNEAISEFMFELSDRDANNYVQNVGYGYAAGYLMTHKIPMPESAKNSRLNGPSTNAIPVNPITGQRLDRESGPDLPQMTMEEKEREAERLFVLFERLKATGVVNVKNPVEAARDEGRIQELNDSDSD